MRELADEFTVIAPDTPGNGLSAPLPPGSTMADFADGVADFLAEIGVERFIVYGFHTGAACALAIALRHPGRNVAAIANGYIQMDAAELADVLEQYLPPFRIEWSGAHLAWSWARIREQYIFFPWYRRTEAARLRTGLPRTELLHAAVMDLLRAGDGYRHAYHAAFTFDRAAAVRQVTIPTLVMVSKTDALSHYLERLQAPGKWVRIERPNDYAAARQILAEFARQYRDRATVVPASAPARAQPEQLWADCLSVDHGSVYSLRNTDAPGRPLLFVHDTAGSALGMAHLMKRWIGRRPVLAIDLPGNGESELPPSLEGDALRHLTVVTQATWLSQAVRVAGYDDVDVCAQGGGGAAVAWELARLHPTLVASTHIANRLVSSEAARAEMLARDCVPIHLDPHGTHLLQVWNRVRDEFLFEPWYHYKRENVLSNRIAELAPDLVHQRTLDMLKCLPRYPALRRLHLEYRPPA